MNLPPRHAGYKARPSTTSGDPPVPPKGNGGGSADPRPSDLADARREAALDSLLDLSAARAGDGKLRDAIALVRSALHDDADRAAALRAGGPE